MVQFSQLKGLITVIFPNGVRYLLFHIFISSYISSIFPLKFKSTIVESPLKRLILKDQIVYSPTGSHFSSIYLYHVSSSLSKPT